MKVGAHSFGGFATTAGVAGNGVPAAAGGAGADGAAFAAVPNGPFASHSLHGLSTLLRLGDLLFPDPLPPLRGVEGRTPGAARGDLRLPLDPRDPLDPFLDPLPDPFPDPRDRLDPCDERLLELRLPDRPERREPLELRERRDPFEAREPREF